MIIPLGEYRIKTDKYNFTLQRKRKGQATDEPEEDKDGEWSLVGHHHSLKSAVEDAFQHEIKMSQADSIQMVLQEVERAEKSITAALNAMYQRKREQYEQANLFDWKEVEVQ